MLAKRTGRPATTAEPEWPSYPAYVAPSSEPAATTQSPEWPTYNAYVAPETTAVTGSAGYEESSGGEEYAEEYGGQEESVYYGESTLPKEKLFTDEDPASFGNMRPEPKKKEGAVPLHLKMAKGNILFFD